MNRYRIHVEYNGTDYAGFQTQKDAPSIQQEIEIAIQKFCGIEARLFAAGRTDAGVHAFGQVCHFDIEKEVSPHNIIGALNFFLRGKQIVITHAEQTSEDFHARFSAIARSYRYKILNRPAPSALYENLAWHVAYSLDVEKMQEASNYLIGTHDFTSFRATACQAKSPVKTVDYIAISKDEDFIYLDIKAKSFLHHMVRNITGTLKLVGSGKIEPIDVKNMLEAKARAASGPTAPACGLYFMQVWY